MAGRANYRTREECVDLICRLTPPLVHPIVMLAGGRQILQAAVCEETYYVSAQAVGIPEGEAHELLQQMTDRGMRPTTPRDYRNAWSWLLERYFADKA